MFHRLLALDRVAGAIELLVVDKALQAVALHETHYGRGWKGDMQGSHNWGAITCFKKNLPDGSCPPGCTPSGDSRPSPSGQVSYTACFQRFPDDARGAEVLINTVYRKALTRRIMHSADLDAVAWAMHKNGYFTGVCAGGGPSEAPPCAEFTPRVAAAQYAEHLERATRKIAAALGEPLAARRSGWLGGVPKTGADGKAVGSTRAYKQGIPHLGAVALCLLGAGLIASLERSGYV